MEKCNFGIFHYIFKLEVNYCKKDSFTRDFSDYIGNYILFHIIFPRYLISTNPQNFRASLSHVQLFIIHILYLMIPTQLHIF